MKTLLIADDERTIREGIADSLNWESFGISQIFLAADGREAYELIKNERPDIAILDIIMPEMTGIEIISRFKNEVESPEFVIISGYDDFEYAREAIRNNVNNYILKPCDISEIANTIKTIISKIDCQQSIEEERQHLKKHLDLLKPQAQEQIMRDFLTNTPTNSFELFQQVFGQCCETFQLLLFCFEDPNNYSKLTIFKEYLEQTWDLSGWSFSVILHDDVVLIFDAEENVKIKDTLKKVYKTAAETLVANIKSAISNQGCIKDLPEMYKRTREALRLYSSFNSLKGEIPLIDVSISQYSKTIQQVIEYTRENLSNTSLTLNHIASNVLYLNPDYLGKLFKKECGVKFSDYLMNLRMEKAKQIIAKSIDLKMYEVAQQVGLGNNTAYFGQVFRKYIGMLPSEYKMKLTTNLNIKS